MIKDGLVTDGEAEELMQLSVNTDGIVVEIGSYTGKSTVALAHGGSRVFAIDLWDLHLPSEKPNKARNKKDRKIRFNSTEAMKTFLKRLEEQEVTESVTWIRGESKEVAKAWSRPIGGLFIDGAHDAKSVKADYTSWSKFIEPGGWIAFHDAHGSNGVMHVLENIVKPSGLWGNFHQVERLAVAFRKIEFEADEDEPEAETAVEDDEAPDVSSDTETVPVAETPPAARRPRRTKKDEIEEEDSEVQLDA